ncbi:Protein of unknown function [Bacillus cereus]|nr:Protein of unknown function [Bacillus cereus]
MKEKGLEKVS